MIHGNLLGKCCYVEILQFSLDPQGLSSPYWPKQVLKAQGNKKSNKGYKLFPTTKSIKNIHTDNALT
jgi:hypothetical protein